MWAYETQGDWATYRKRARIDTALERIDAILAEIARFGDPVITGDAANATWRPGTLRS